VLESAAASLPILSTALGVEGIPMEDQDSCLIAEDPDAWWRVMESIMADPVLAGRLAEEALKVVEAYSKERSARRTLELYQRLSDWPLRSS
jgi:glycosyltransferase involved in cell wall biosynthesis